MTPFDIRYQLLILTKNNEKSVLIFQDFQLKCETLLKIFYPARELLQLDNENFLEKDLGKIY